jgi:hypothetical protein
MMSLLSPAAASGLVGLGLELQVDSKSKGQTLTRRLKMTRLLGHSTRARQRSRRWDSDCHGHGWRALARA